MISKKTFEIQISVLNKGAADNFLHMESWWRQLYYYWGSLSAFYFREAVTRSVLTVDHDSDSHPLPTTPSWSLGSHFFSTHFFLVMKWYANVAGTLARPAHCTALQSPSTDMESKFLYSRKRIEAKWWDLLGSRRLCSRGVPSWYVGGWHWVVGARAVRISDRKKTELP